MTHARTMFTIALAIAATSGCGSKKKEGGGAGSSTASDGSAAEAPAKKALTADFFGKKVAPPGALAKLTWGQTAAEARAAAPELFPKKDDALQSSDVAGVDGAAYAVGIDKDTHLVSRMYVSLPKTAAPLVATAWGKGLEAKDSIGKPRTYWFDAETGWRAYLEPSFGDDLSLEFYRYLPAAKLLGDGGDTLGFAPQGILGATIDELRTRFPKTLVETDAAKAAEEQKKTGAFVGKDLDKDLGAAQASVRLDLPPTEWESYWTRVQIDFGDDHKVEDVWFDLPYEAYAPAKDELKALLDKKWGAPKEGTDLGEKIWIYRDAAPTVIVKDDEIMHAWNVRISTKKPD